MWIVAFKQNIAKILNEEHPTCEAMPNQGTHYSPWTCPITEHLTHHGPAPPWNTLLSVDLPHRGRPKYPWTFPLRNSLIIVVLPHRGIRYPPWTVPPAEHPTHRGPFPMQSTLLNSDFPHRITCYSPLTYPTAEHPSHL